MNAKQPMGVLHSFSITSNFYYKMDLRLSYFHVTKCQISYFTSEVCGNP